ncbi:hypothetical protein P9112_003259 [Eukaryota sp. TZLM1-RC]
MLVASQMKVANQRRLFLLQLVADALKHLADSEMPKKLNDSFLDEPLDQDLLGFVVSITDRADLPSPLCIIACIYILRLKKWNPHLKISEANVRRLFLVSAMLSSKVHEDVIFRNVDWARLSDVYNSALLNQMEIEFLSWINFQTTVTFDEFKNYIDCLTSRSSIKPSVLKSLKGELLSPFLEC